MSTIGYSVAVALLGSSAALASQIVVTADEPVVKRVEIAVSTGASSSSYDFNKFRSEVMTPVAVTSATPIKRLKPLRLASLAQDELKIIVRDEALAQKVDSLAAAATTVVPDNENDLAVTGEEILTPSVEASNIVPLPKARPAYTAVQKRPASTRKRAVQRKAKRYIQVAEANTTRQSRLAKRLRNKGWLIGAFR